MLFQWEIVWAELCKNKNIHSNFIQIFSLMKQSSLQIQSSLHWPILLLFYALFIQWSMLWPTIKLHLPSPISLISSSQSTIFLYFNTKFLHISHSHLPPPNTLQYTPLFKNEQNEGRISQWRLLSSLLVFIFFCLFSANRSYFYFSFETPKGVAPQVLKQAANLSCYSSWVGTHVINSKFVK